MNTKCYCKSFTATDMCAVSACVEQLKKKKNSWFWIDKRIALTQRKADPAFSAPSVYHTKS